MNAYSWITLYLSSFGTVAFALLIYLTLRADKKPPALEFYSSLAISLLSTIWFVLGVFEAVPYLLQLITTARWQFLFTCLATLFPPLICQIFYASERDKLSRGWPWLAGLVPSWLFSLYCFSTMVAAYAGATEMPGQTVALFIQGGFSYTAIYCIVLLVWVRRLDAKRRPHEEDKTPREAYRNRILIVLAVLLALPLAFWTPLWKEVGFLLARSMPLTFVFIGLYYQHRYEFFDLVIKQGLYFFLVFGALLLFFAGIPTLFPDLPEGDEGLLVMTVLALPLALCLPAAYKLLSRVLDQWWFGRRFEATEAAKEFLAGVRDSTDEQSLRELSERKLGEIFLADVKVETHQARAGEEEAQLIRSGEYRSITALRMPIQADGMLYGALHMGKRQSQMPYFHTDQKLIQTLAEILARMLENLRLHEKRKMQEKREQDLKLHASRSELKALRAQINPHFLFNALNAIASLIHQKPELAEETVEQLAEVFRYTLRRSKQEWVQLEDEFDFLSAYLDVEKARFGERLEYSMELDEEARETRVPGMIVQTLVENAVKHGLSAVRGTGRIAVRARKQGGRLLLEVEDNGPGFELEEGLKRSSRGRLGEGFGLKSIDRRLRGYFGDQARFEVVREQERGVTSVRIEMPADLPADQEDVQARTG
ncbi:MAG TPA: histidine kinase [Acidobacteriota bacterium]|nr:histidine kinase [Acidobacteriota bacterium]